MKTFPVRFIKPIEDVQKRLHKVNKIFPHTTQWTFNMETPRLQTIAYNAIFLVFLRLYNFNTPLTLFIMSSLSFIPQTITEHQFSMIRSIEARLSHQITLYSYDPLKLKKYIDRIPSMRHRLVTVRKPMMYSIRMSTEYPFLQYLRDISTTMADLIPIEARKIVLPKIIHTVELSFDYLMWGYQMKIPIHKGIKNIVVKFPANYDFHSQFPTLYEIFRNARHQNIDSQPVFTGDDACVIPRSFNQCHLTYIYKCPNCRGQIYNHYNCITQKFRGMDFISKNFERYICKCPQCTDMIHSSRGLPKPD